jgi:hypothetical protein
LLINSFFFFNLIILLIWILNQFLPDVIVQAQFLIF